MTIDRKHFQKCQRATLTAPNSSPTTPGRANRPSLGNREGRCAERIRRNVLMSGGMCNQEPPYSQCGRQDHLTREPVEIKPEPIKTEETLRLQPLILVRSSERRFPARLHV